MSQKLTVDASAAGRGAAKAEPVDYIYEQPPARIAGSAAAAVRRDCRSTAPCSNRPRPSMRRA